MPKRQTQAPHAGTIDLTLWGADKRCLLISGPLPLLGELIRTIQQAGARGTRGEGTEAPAAAGHKPERDGDAA
jgi:hypothetical protein